MRALPVLAAVMVATAVACQQNDVAEKSSTTPAEDLRATHDRLRDEWIAAANRDDAATVAGMYAENAVFILPNGQVLNGRAAIQQALPDYFATAANLVVNEQTFEQSGDVVYVTGEFSEDMTTPDKKTVKNTGKYLVVTQRQPDGKLLIVRHAGVPVMPAPNPN